MFNLEWTGKNYDRDGSLVNRFNNLANDFCNEKNLVIDDFDKNPLIINDLISNIYDDLFEGWSFIPDNFEIVF